MNGFRRMLEDGRQQTADHIPVSPYNSSLLGPYVDVPPIRRNTLRYCALELRTLMLKTLYMIHQSAHKTPNSHSTASNGAKATFASSAKVCNNNQWPCWFW